MNTKKSIYVGILNMGSIRPELSEVITYIQNQTNYNAFVDYSHSKPISNNRNKIVQRFLAHSGFDYLLMVDSDIVPIPTVLDLADYQKDIIGALCFMYQQDRIMPVVFNRNKDGLYGSIKIKDKEGLVEVDAVGTGCIMLSRKVLEAVKAPFLNEYDPDGIKQFGLDVAFCRRAKEKGFKVYAHLDYPCDHWQTMNLRRLFAVETAYASEIKKIKSQLNEQKGIQNIKKTDRQTASKSGR